MLFMSTGVVLPEMPNRLREVFRRWDGDGRNGQGGMWWNRATWLTGLPKYQELFASLPDRVDRATVARHAANAADGEIEAERAFVAAMVWGYGPTGYGAYRTARVLGENPEARPTLHTAAQIVKRDGGARAFEWLSEHRLRYLGVSFATKYLYFCNGPDAPPALILDQLVQRWLRQHAGCHLRLEWHVGDYDRYLRMACSWAEVLGIAAGDVEYLMFSDALVDEPGRTAALADGSLDDPEDGAVLTAIEEAAVAFAALADVSPADVDDFERGIRQLKRIVLARNA
ncbi:hypothetical protein SAMN05421684_5105 [Asanoa ishikariensis]|uniref:Uncharacterized protein n=2 Tax=Asanoa ishikariensis TaxID=137265 RepID=A0A1H3T222_9ACTN|nr:hypothetical protein SAMN05421684_5105 [Asanoa ishikariensis]